MKIDGTRKTKENFIIIIICLGLVWRGEESGCIQKLSKDLPKKKKKKRLSKV